jgi:hypothetical protein
MAVVADIRYCDLIGLDVKLRSSSFAGVKNRLQRFSAKVGSSVVQYLTFEKCNCLKIFYNRNIRIAISPFHKVQGTGTEFLKFEKG